MFHALTVETDGLGSCDESPCQVTDSSHWTLCSCMLPALIASFRFYCPIYYFPTFYRQPGVSSSDWINVWISFLALQLKPSIFQQCWYSNGLWTLTTNLAFSLPSVQCRVFFNDFLNSQLCRLQIRLPVGYCSVRCVSLLDNTLFRMIARSSDYWLEISLSSNCLSTTIACVLATGVRQWSCVETRCESTALECEASCWLPDDNWLCQSDQTRQWTGLRCNCDFSWHYVIMSLQLISHDWTLLSIQGPMQLSCAFASRWTVKCDELNCVCE